jgi:RNA polymerase sigma factor (sigma-70 family)
MRHFELQLRIRNNRLKQRRLELGLTPAGLAERAGLGYGLYLEYENLRRSPLRKQDLEWRPSALKLASFFGATPSELWPEAILAVQKHTLTTRVDAQTLLLGYESLVPAALPSPEEHLERAEQQKTLVEAMGSALTTREIRVLEATVEDERSCADVGRDHGLSGERVRQIRARALRKLRRRLRDAEPPSEAEG